MKLGTPFSLIKNALSDIRVMHDFNYEIPTETREEFWKDECEIHWDHTMERVYNFIRGLNPFPAAYSFCNKKLYKIYFVEKYDRDYKGELGEVVDLIKGKGPVVKVLDGSVIITSIKPENKRKITGADIVNGNYIKKGEKFSIGKKEIKL